MKELHCYQSDTVSISNCLWRRLVTLHKPASTPVSEHSASDIATHFANKVDGIRAQTMYAPAPIIKQWMYYNLDAIRRRRPMKFLPCFALRKINSAPLTCTNMVDEGDGRHSRSCHLGHDKQVVRSRSFPIISKESHRSTTIKQVITGSS